MLRVMFNSEDYDKCIKVVKRICGKFPSPSPSRQALADGAKQHFAHLLPFDISPSDAQHNLICIPCGRGL